MSTTDDGPADFTRNHVELSAGPVSFREAGSGEPLVFVHGYGVNGTLWDRVISRLAGSYRCILPDLPFGSHPTAMKPDADLSPVGAAAIVGEFITALGLEDATVIANDSGGAISQIFLTEQPAGADRVARLVLTNCDAFEDFPPGIFKLLVKTLRTPGGADMVAGSLRSRSVQRSKLGYGSLSKDTIPDELLDSWVGPFVGDKAVRRDARKCGAGMDPKYTLAAAAKLPSLEIPVLLAWGERDSLFTIESAERLQRAIPDATLVRFHEALTFVSLDEPERLAEEISKFCAERPVAATPVS